MILKVNTRYYSVQILLAGVIFFLSLPANAYRPLRGQEKGRDPSLWFETGRISELNELLPFAESPYAKLVLQIKSIPLPAFLNEKEIQGLFLRGKTFTEVETLAQSSKRPNRISVLTFQEGKEKNYSPIDPDKPYCKIQTALGKSNSNKLLANKYQIIETDSSTIGQTHLFEIPEDLDKNRPLVTKTQSVHLHFEGDKIMISVLSCWKDGNSYITPQEMVSIIGSGKIAFENHDPAKHGTEND